MVYCPQSVTVGYNSTMFYGPHKPWLIQGGVTEMLEDMLDKSKAERSGQKGWGLVFPV